MLCAAYVPQHFLASYAPGHKSRWNHHSTTGPKLSFCARSLWKKKVTANPCVASIFIQIPHDLTSRPALALVPKHVSCFFSMDSTRHFQIHPKLFSFMNSFITKWALHILNLLLAVFTEMTYCLCGWPLQVQTCFSKRNCSNSSNCSFTLIHLVKASIRIPWEPSRNIETLSQFVKSQRFSDNYCL